MNPCWSWGDLGRWLLAVPISGGSQGDGVRVVVLGGVFYQSEGLVKWAGKILSYKGAGGIYQGMGLRLGRMRLLLLFLGRAG